MLLRISNTNRQVKTFTVAALNQNIAKVLAARLIKKILFYNIQIVEVHLTTVTSNFVRFARKVPLNLTFQKFSYQEMKTYYLNQDHTGLLRILQTTAKQWLPSSGLGHWTSYISISKQLCSTSSKALQKKLFRQHPA